MLCWAVCVCVYFIWCWLCGVVLCVRHVLWYGVSCRFLIFLLCVHSALCYELMCRTHRRNAAVSVSDVVGFFRRSLARSLAMSVCNLFFFCFFIIFVVIIFRMSTFNVMFIWKSLRCVCASRQRAAVAFKTCTVRETIKPRWQIKCVCVCVVCVILSAVDCLCLSIFLLSLFSLGKKTSN